MILTKEFNIIKKDPILILTLPLASLVFILIFLLRPIILLRFGLLHSDRLGHFSSNTELFLCENKISKNKKKIINFFYFPTTPCNKQLAKMIKRKLPVYPKILCRPFCLLSRKFRFLKDHVTGKSLAGDYDVLNLYKKIPTQINLTKKEKKKGEEILKSIGAKDKQIILFIVRDSKYFKMHYNLKSNIKSHHDHRNDDIENYRSSIVKLLKRGYFVVRMGNIAEKSLKINNRNFIDYPFSKIKTDFMDIYFAYRCFFCVSNLTGYDGLITMFRKPLLSIGSMPIGCMYSSTDNYLNTMYAHYSKNLKRKLNLKEIFELGLAFEFKKEIFDKKNIIIQKHNSNEIKKFVFEMIDYLKNKSKFKNFKLNKEAKKKYNKLLDKYQNKDNKIYNGKLYFSFSKYFLEKNKHLFNYD